MNKNNQYKLFPQIITYQHTLLQAQFYKALTLLVLTAQFYDFINLTNALLTYISVHDCVSELIVFI